MIFRDGKPVPYKRRIKMLTHVGTNTIETERLILRRFGYEDNESMRNNWIADEKIQSLYSEPVYSTEKEVRELLDKYIGEKGQIQP